MNVVDIVLLLLLTYAAVRGFRQGALNQVAAFGGSAVGLVLGVIFAPRIAGRFVSEPGAALALLTLALLAMAILVGQGIGFAIGMRLRAAVADTSADPVDRTAGILVGLVALLLTVWFLGSALMQGPLPVISQQVQSSRIVSAVGRALPPAPNLVGRVGVYLQLQGFPQVFTGLGQGGTAPPVAAPSDAVVQAAQAAGQASTVQVQSTGCGGISSGSGFVTADGFIVTNAHVVAGGQELTVRDASGVHPAVTIHFDPQLDLAVVSSPESTAPPIAFSGVPVDRGAQGATLGYPGGQQQLVIEPAAVRQRGTALGRDIYGQALADREVLTLSADVVQGDSGGPFVTADGLVSGVVFAASAAEEDVGYALTVPTVAPDVAAAIARNQPSGVGECRF